MVPSLPSLLNQTHSSYWRHDLAPLLTLPSCRMLTALSLAAAMAVVIPLGRIGSYITVDGVYVHGEGPFRFLVDTGAQSSAVPQRVAARVGLRPEARVEQATSAGSRLIPVAQADVALNGLGSSIELLIGGIDRLRDLDRGIEGVLGSNFLARRFCIDYRQSVLTIDAPVPAGKRIPIEVVDGRSVVSAL